MKKIATILFAFATIVCFSQIRTDLPISTAKTSVLLKSNPKGKNKLYIDFKTGNDNLEHRDFQKNVDVILKLVGKPDIIFENVNQNQNWPNNSIRRFTGDLPDDIKLVDFLGIVINRGNANGGYNNVEAIGGDNWNLQKLSINVKITENGVYKTFPLAEMKGVNNQPLFRFVYEDRNACANCGLSFHKTFEAMLPETRPSANTSEKVNAKISFAFGTGGDNLEGGNDNNVNVNLVLRDRRKISINRINSGRKWENFTESNREMEIPNSKNLDINTIESVEIRHTGGGGMGADNWDVDKIKISISKDGNSRILIDKVGAPIHRFTGDSRVLRIAVN